VERPCGRPSDCNVIVVHLQAFLGRACYSATGRLWVTHIPIGTRRNGGRFEVLTSSDGIGLAITVRVYRLNSTECGRYACECVTLSVCACGRHIVHSKCVALHCLGHGQREPGHRDTGVRCHFVSVLFLIWQRPLAADRSLRLVWGSLFSGLIRSSFSSSMDAIYRHPAGHMTAPLRSGWRIGNLKQQGFWSGISPLSACKLRQLLFLRPEYLLLFLFHNWSFYMQKTQIMKSKNNITCKLRNII